MKRFTAADVFWPAFGEIIVYETNIEVISLSPINLSEAQPLRLITNTRAPLPEPVGA